MLPASVSSVMAMNGRFALFFFKFKVCLSVFFLIFCVGGQESTSGMGRERESAATNKLHAVSSRVWIFVAN